MKNQLDYFFKNFELLYNIEDIEIEYGKPGEKTISIVKNCDDSFWLERNDINIDKVVWKEWNGVKIPFLFAKNDLAEIITIKDGKAVINYDIISSTFYFLSGWSEYVNSLKDEFGRIRYENSIVFKLNISNTPVVNYYFDILYEAICKIYNKEIKKDLYDKHNFAVSLTHDIDTCKSCWLEGSFSEFKKKRFFSIPQLIFKKIFTRDDWFNFEDIVEIEKKYNTSSSFYFLPQKGKIGKWKNADYNIKSKGIQNAIKYLKEKGKEVGVHGSFGTHVNKKMLQNDIIRINSKPITGNRFHFLMFDLEKTVSVLEDCNIKYDTSLGFAEKIGFRRSTCSPFYLYNFERNDTSSVIEIPLIVMDSSLSNKKYMGIKQETAIQQVFELIDEVAKFGGVFTILWHNTFFSDYKYTGWREVYCIILEYCIKNRGLLTNGKIIYEKIIKL